MRLTLRKFAVLLIIGAGATIGFSFGGLSEMQTFIMDAIRDSEIVAVGTVRRSGITTVDGHEFLRIDVDDVDLFKGQMGSQRTLIVAVRTAGKETPQIELSKEYLFFLRSARQTGRGWQLVDLTRPVEVSPQQRQIFLNCLRESVRLSSQITSGADLKQHLVKMLSSGVTFFQSDAARVALTVTDWRQVEIDELINILHGKNGPGLHGINERENITTVVVQHGTVNSVISYARSELKKGNSDPIYYGLFKRGGQDVDVILWTLLRDTDVAVKVQALRVAGLLRRPDILDSFEKQLEQNADPQVRVALASARTLVSRD